MSTATAPLVTPKPAITRYQARVMRPYAEQRDDLFNKLWEAAYLTTGKFDLTTMRSWEKLILKLEACCQNPIVRLSPDDSAVQIAERRCRHRLCPRCQHKRSWQMQAKLHNLLSTADDLRFITLTVAHNQKPLAEQIKRLTRSFAKLRRMKVWKQLQRGGTYCIEVTYNPASDTWHPHLHIISDGHFIAHAQLKALWHRITGDSHIVDIRRCGSKRSLVKYVAKYVSKTFHHGRIPATRLPEWIEATRGLRMLGTYGTMHGVELDTDDDDEQPAETEEFIELTEVEDAAERGDPVAAGLHTDIIEAAKGRLSVPHGETRENRQRRVRTVAQCLRAWKRHKQEPRRNNDPNAPPATWVNRPDQRSFRFGEKQDDG